MDIKKWLWAYPFLGYKESKKPVDKIPLSEIELMCITSKQFNTARLGTVRDVFLFSCFTGLAYAGPQMLKKEDAFIGLEETVVPLKGDLIEKWARQLPTIICPALFIPG